MPDNGEDAIGIQGMTGGRVAQSRSIRPLTGASNQDWVKTIALYRAPDDTPGGKSRPIRQEARGVQS